MKKKLQLLASVLIVTFTQAEHNNIEHSIKIGKDSLEYPVRPTFNHLFGGYTIEKNFYYYLESTIIDEPFNNYTDNGWTTYNIAGAQVWSIISFGNPAPAAIMNGFLGINEDWLISKNIDLASGYDFASFSFQTDASFQGNPLEVYITADTYSNGDAPDTVTWKRLNATLDSDLTGYHGFVPSGNIDLTTYVGKNVRIAFRYTNVLSTTATSWEIDNFRVVASKTLGVKNASSEKIKLYPNPVKEILNFSEEVSDVKITDISGKFLKEISVNGKTLDISKLEKGIYVVMITLKSGKTIINKIVKE